MLVYVDNCIISKIIDSCWDPRFGDKEAFKKIQAQNSVTFLISLMTMREIEAAPNEKLRTALTKIAATMTVVPSRPTMSISMATIGGPSTQDVDLTRLRKFFSTRHHNARGKALTNDADHIYYAKEAGCDFFMTIDRDTILKRYAANHEAVKSIIGKMEIVDPVALWNEYLSLPN